MILQIVLSFFGIGQSTIDLDDQSSFLVDGDPEDIQVLLDSDEETQEFTPRRHWNGWKREAFPPYPYFRLVKHGDI